MRKFIGFAILSFLLNFFTYGQPDHLQPTTGVFDINPLSFAYYSELRAHLLDSIGLSEVKYVEIPAWGPEGVLMIHKAVEGPFLIHYRQPNQSIWYARTAVPNPKIEVLSFWKNIETADAAIIQELFVVCLRQMKVHESNTRTPDVSKHYFSVRAGRLPTGVTETPDDETNMKELVDIMSALIVATKSEGTENLRVSDELRNRITHLTEKISNKNP